MPSFGRSAADCAAPVIVGARDDNYPVTSLVPGAPVYRSVCGDVWFHVDGGDRRA